MQTARVTFLTTPQRKARIEQNAARIGLSSGEYIRHALDNYEQLSPEEEAELTLLVEQVNDAIPKMCAALDRMNAKLEETHGYVDSMLRDAGFRT